MAAQAKGLRAHAHLDDSLQRARLIHIALSRYGTIPGRHASLLTSNQHTTWANQPSLNNKSYTAQKDLLWKWLPTTETLNKWRQTGRDP